MEQVKLHTWEEFEARVTKLTSEREARLRATGKYISEYLFRGQADTSWRLITTLERYTGQLLTLKEYYRVLCAAKPQIETFTGTTWEKVPSFGEYEKEVGEEGLLPPGKFPAYDYFVYLRHHGFPSPLLDWTRSPYVAAYFAFRDVSSTADTVSVYAYCEYTAGHKSGASNVPKIKGLGPYVRSHRRHFQQQSEYTICTIHRDGEHAYACHEDAFAGNKEDQDELWKFDIPSTEREKVLKRLEQYTFMHSHYLGLRKALWRHWPFVSCSSERAANKRFEGSAEQRRCSVPVALRAPAPPQPQR